MFSGYHFHICNLRGLKSVGKDVELRETSHTAVGRDEYELVAQFYRETSNTY